MLVIKVMKKFGQNLKKRNNGTIKDDSNV